MNRALFLLGFLTAAAYWPGAMDPALSARWIVLGVGVPLCLLLAVEVAPIPSMLIACLAAAGASLLWTPDVLNGLDEFAHLVIVAGAFWLGLSLHDARPVWKGVILGVSVSAILAITQLLGLISIPEAASPSGLFGNKNYLAEAGMVALVAAAMLKMWWLLPFALIAVIAPASKAVFGACIVAFALWLAPRRPITVAWGLAGSAMLLGVALFAGDHPSAAARLDIWQESFAAVSLVGFGLGSYATLFPTYEYTHSEPLQLVFELGLLSIPFFVLAVQSIKGWSSDVELEALVLSAVAAVALLSFPLHLPLTAFVAAVAAGRLLGARHLMVERRVAWRGAFGAAAR